MKKHVLCAIFARGGSKRVPRKNLLTLAGQPLIAHAIKVGLQSALIDQVIVSTDDDEIADVAREYGAEIPFVRPAELASDEASEWMAWQHAIRTMQAREGQPNIDAFVCIPTTAPLRDVADVDLCIQTLLTTDADVVITVQTAEHNPYYNMVRSDARGYVRQVIESESSVYRRGAYPTVYSMTTVAYVARPSFVLNSVSPFSGRVKAVRIPAERALDIDTELDFKFAEFMFANRTTGAGGKAEVLEGETEAR